MIQRIQSLYMLLSVVAGVICLANPIAHFTTSAPVAGLIPAGDLYNLWLSVPNEITGEYAHKLTPWVAEFALLAFASAFTLLNIFIYKHRPLQMRTLLFCAMVLVGYYVVGGVFVWRLCQEYSLSVRPTVYAALPMVSMIFDVLAFVSIRKDDDLVRSLDRLR